MKLEVSVKAAELEEIIAKHLKATVNPETFKRLPHCEIGEKYGVWTMTLKDDAEVESERQNRLILAKWEAEEKAKKNGKPLSNVSEALKLGEVHSSMATADMT